VKLRLATKYTLCISLLLILVVSLVLLGLAALGKHHLDQFRSELTQALTTAKTIDNERVLQANAKYLHRRLFNPMYNLDISSLNEEIKLVRQLLPVTEFLILDRQGTILTDGTKENKRYGEALSIPNLLKQQTTQFLENKNTLKLNLIIGSKDFLLGYAFISLNNQALLDSIGILNKDMSRMNDRLLHSLLLAFLGTMILTILLGVLLSRSLSRFLSRPLTEMSKAAERYAQGQLTYPLPVRTEDELGELAYSLNKMAADLHKSEGQIRAIVNNSTTVINIKDRNGHYLLINKRFQELFLIDQTCIKGKTDYDLFSEQTAALLQRNDQTVLASNLPMQFEESFIQNDGQHTYISDKFPLYLADGTAYAICSISTDITQRKNWENQLRKSEENLSTTLNSIGDGVITTDADGFITRINPVAVELTGWATEDAVGLSIHKVVQIIDETSHIAIPLPVERCIEEGIVIGLANHTLLIRRDGKKIAIEDSMAPIRHAKNDISGIVLVFHDVTKARHLAAKLSYQASHDALTGLINRHEFAHRIEAAQRNAKDRNSQHVMLYIDLDQFKIVNDTSGHVAGDELLKQIASLLKESLREGDTLARLGGDEFGVLLENCPLEKAAKIAEQIRLKLMEFHFIWQDLSFNINCSIGIAPINQTSSNLSEVLSAADLACIAAKDGGRNRIHIADTHDQGFIQRKGEMRWLPRLQNAFKNDNFHLYAQKIIACTDKSHPIKHIELLLRLQENDLIIPPGAFIPAAERYNFMPQIDNWVISRVFAYIQQQSTDANIKYAINLSGASISDPTLVKYIFSQSDKFKIAPEKICFEITETAAIANLTNASNLIKTLKSEGFSFALDDFGSGLSSFAYLKNLPVDYLKIDGMFVKDIVNDPLDYTMVKSINDIGHSMGIKTIAEYVENAEILDQLTNLGVDYAQGFYIHKPEPIRNFDF
jgi:diguanylate cyclase (GGDEF)-like protein/PAS domain S-box-containing protein